jgi:CubicO group peptidase (beta-lactamase class C family)
MIKKYFRRIISAMPWIPATCWFFLILSSFSGVRAQSFPASTLGFSSSRLERLDSSLQGWVDRHWINGAVGMIVRDGHLAYYHAAGFKDIEAGIPMEKDDIFRIASQTKAITSVAVMMLYEEGKFLLDDPVSKYLPSFGQQKVLDKFNASDSSYTTVPEKREITIRDLLTHTSGIGYAQIGTREASAIYAKSHLMAGFYVKEDRLADAMDRLGSLPLMHQPGDKWTYGLNVDLLGRLVELWSGISLDSFFRNRIFEPLGMKDSYFTIPKSKSGRLVKHYVETEGHFVKQLQTFGVDMNYPLLAKTYFSGGAGLSGTISDYAVFLQMLLNGGQWNGKQLLSRNTVRMMTMNQIGDMEVSGEKFGLGFRINTENSSRIDPRQAGTYGWGGAFSTVYWVDPKEKMITILYRQMWGSHGADIDNKFLVLAYQALQD